MELQKKSKLLAYILRHKPESVDITLNLNGWASIDEIVKNTNITLFELQKIVETDNKSRYEINSKDWTIRAVQGHSIDNLEIELDKGIALFDLYHGTSSDSVEQIMKEGLCKMNRQYVHLSKDIKTAEIVAQRRKGPISILVIDGTRMQSDGFKFYVAKNGVWLIDHVPSKYIKIK